jgi:hypothetical protein
VSTYNCNATIIFAVQFDGITIEFVLFEKETRKENKSLVYVPNSYN